MSLQKPRRNSAHPKDFSVRRKGAGFGPHHA
jgi:hypothetical protein